MIFFFLEFLLFNCSEIACNQFLNSVTDGSSLDVNCSSIVLSFFCVKKVMRSPHFSLQLAYSIAKIKANIIGHNSINNIHSKLSSILLSINWLHIVVDKPKYPTVKIPTIAVQENLGIDLVIVVVLLDRSI